MYKTKNIVLILSWSTLIAAVLFAVFAIITDNSVCITLAITFGTTFYHFAMRLFVGKVVGHRFNYKNFWFREKFFEKSFYKTLRVKKWKNKMPTFNPDSYLTKANVSMEIVNTMCRNEVIHEIIALLSFVPILFSLFFDALWVFVITSVIACLFDLIFVIMQRYNRPRIIRIMERQKKGCK